MTFEERANLMRNQLSLDLDPLQYALERIIFRRTLEKRVDGYTIETAKELAQEARETLAAIEYVTT